MVTGKDSEKPETEETPDQFVIRLKNYLAKWLELSGSSLQNFDALVDLIVKEQFINACSEDLAMYLLERGPKDLVELTTWAQKYLIAHKEQLGKSKATVQPRRADQKKTIQSKPDLSQGRQRSLQCYRCRGFGHRQSECGTKISPGKDQKGSSTPVSQSSQKKTHVMVAQLDEDGEMVVKRLLLVYSSKEPDPGVIRSRVVPKDRPTVTGRYTVLFAVPRVMMVRPTWV